MLGLMQETPLLIPSVIDHAARCHGDREIVSRLCDGTVSRTNYARIRTRSWRLARLLDRLGIGVEDKVATLAWNTHRHLETIYAVTGVAPSITRSTRGSPQSRSLISPTTLRIVFSSSTRHFFPLSRTSSPSSKP